VLALILRLFAESTDMNVRIWVMAVVGIVVCGCATMKESDTARTGIEQLLISSAADQALAKIDFQPIARAKVFLDPQYLDCVDKNYIVVALHQRLLNNGCTLVGKAEEADVVLEVASGGVGTDRNELFVGIPEIPLPPPSPIAVPKLAFYTRTRAMGTAKLAIVAYDAKSKAPLINTGYSLARADHKNWTVLGMGGIQGGSVPQEIATATGESDGIQIPTAVAHKPTHTAPPAQTTVH
jgi:hypothetical protein